MGPGVAGHAGLLVLAGRPLRTLDRRVAAVAGALPNWLVVIVGGSRDISLAIAGELALAGLDLLERVVSGAPCLALFGVAGRRGLKRLVGVGDLVAVAVVLDQPGGLAPGAPAADALGGRAERLGEVGGLVDLSDGGACSAAPGQFSDDVAVGDPEVGVGFDPGVTLLLCLAGLEFGVQGAGRLLGGQRVGGVVRQVWVAAPPLRAGRLGALDLGEGLLGLLAPFGGALEYAAAVGRGLVEELAELVTLATQLRSGNGADVQAAGRVDRQRLAAEAGERVGELVVGVGGFALGEVDLVGGLLGFGSDDGEQAGQVLGAGELHVQPVGVLLAGDAHQRAPAGQPLRLVPGGRIGEVDHAPSLRLETVEVVGVKRDLAALLGADGDRSQADVQGGHGPAGAVGDAEAAKLVAATDDLVADVERPIGDLELLDTEAAVLDHDLLADGVEPVDLVTAIGKDHRILARLAGGLGRLGFLVGGPPIPHQLEGQLGLGPCGDHAVVLAVGVDGLVDLAVADQLERVALPCLALAAVLSEHAGAKP